MEESGSGGRADRLVVEEVGSDVGFGGVISRKAFLLRAPRLLRGGERGFFE